MEDYNRQYFSKTDVDNGLHLKLVKFLLDNFESKEYRVDIHIYHEDCGAVMVEWIRQLWEHVDEMGKFTFLAGDEEIVKERY